jgi:hypothetical protein
MLFGLFVVWVVAKAVNTVLADPVDLEYEALCEVMA